MALKPKNYLSNRDILLEIHKSKNSFCHYTDPSYADYDIILPSIDDIPTALDAAKTTRAKRLQKPVESIQDQDLVFRITSWSHIPFAPLKVKKPKAGPLAEPEDDDLFEDLTLIADLEPAALIHVKLNFPPFLHYKIDSNNQPQLVGKSHWRGDLDTGSFCRDHGKVTDKLAMMWVKLAERLATKPGYRGYSYRDEMESQAILQLVNVGLQFDESKSQNPFAYYTQCSTNSFTRVLNLEKNHRDIRDDLMEIAGLDPSFSRQSSESAPSDE